MVRISKNPEERKSEIMDTAWRLFIDKGYDNTAVSDIVKEIGIAQGTFYYYFRTKDALLNAILEGLLKEVTEKVEGITSLKALTSIEKLKAIIGYFATMDLGSGDWAKFIHDDKNIVMHHKLETKFAERFVPILTNIVKEGISEGNFNTSFPEEAVKILFRGLGTYLQYEILSAKDASSLLEALEVTADIIERVLGAEKGSVQLV